MQATGKLDFNMLGIATTLANAEFKVPTYQRSYAWSPAELQDFWDDLRSSIDSADADYFLGTLVLTRDNELRRLVIIDGQQRLATTTLLLAALRDLWNDLGKGKQASDIDTRYLSVFDRRQDESVPRLIMNEDDDPFFRHLVVSHDGDGHMAAARESHERMNAAKQFLASQLRDDSDAHGNHAEDRLIKWSEFLDENAKVITVTVPSEADAFVIFETLNDRGASLTVGDLLKNYLFMKAADRLGTVKSAWIQALSELDASAENDDFVTFLRHHWSSRYGAVRERDLYREIKAQVKSPDHASRHARELAEAAGLYAALRSPSDDYWDGKGFTTSTKANIESLVRLDLEQNRPLLLAIMTHFTIPEQKRTLRSLVSWSVRGLIVGGIGGGRTEKAYCNAAVRIREGKIKSADELLSELSSIIPDDEVFEDAFSRATISRPAVARYIQLALLRAKSGEEEPELVPNANEDEVNLEHILPRRAKKAEWPMFEPETVASWANRIGNHCLLKKTENGKIGNMAWTVKKPVLLASSLPLTAQAGKYQDWTEASIAERQSTLARIAVIAWPRRPK